MIDEVFQSLIYRKIWKPLRKVNRPILGGKGTHRRKNGRTYLG